MALALLISNCAGTEKRLGHDLKFIVIGNTNPASPFHGFPQRLASVYKSLNRENVVLAIHTGNMAFGGDDGMGILRKDVERQFRKALELQKLLTIIVHHLPGESDQYNGTIDLFERYISKKNLHSFNYADSHFILIPIMNKDSHLSTQEFSWLEEDLAAHKNSSAIFVFSNYPIVSSPLSGARQNEGGSELHALFAKYQVKAAISGIMKNFTEYEKEGVRYINAGCGGFNNEDWQQGYFQYYIAWYDGLNFSMKGVKVSTETEVRKMNIRGRRPRALQ